MRICYFGTYRANYSRNQIMIEGLRRNGVEVFECHEQLWQGIEDRVQSVSGGWKRIGFLWRIARAYGRLLYKYWRTTPDYDIMVVGYPGQFDVFLARLLSWWSGKPLVWDIFMSIYLIALERKLDQQSQGTVQLLRHIERVACSLPDLLVLDTESYVQWFGDTHGVLSERFRLVPTGADTARFRPVMSGKDSTQISQMNTDSESRAAPRSGQTAPFLVVYYGTFIPNHGVSTIVEAAHLLADDETIRFELIGRGPDHSLAMALAKQYELTNLKFIEWLPQNQLVERMADVDICLGAFGTTPQSLMTVQNKIYECLAMGKVVLSGDGPAVRAAMQHREHIYLCERVDPQALAESIRILKADPNLCGRLAKNGHQLFNKKYDLIYIGERFLTHLERVNNR